MNRLHHSIILLLVAMLSLNANPLKAQTDTTYIDTVACDSLISPSGNYVWKANGTYTDTLLNSQGLDSFLIITLTIPEINWQLWYAISGTAVTVFSNATSYQWLNCNNNLNPVSGANTNSIYGTPQGGGTYACELDISGCKDTTDCASISGVGIDELSENGISIFPNPVINELFIESQNQGSLDVEIIDGLGSAISISSYTSGNSIDISSLNSGLGIISLQPKNGPKESFPFVKK